MEQIEDEELCARLLRDVWLRNGMVAAAAFNLRANIKESYISVLRLSSPFFEEDAKQIAKHGTTILYSSLQTKELRELRVDGTDNQINLNVFAIDNGHFKSHAGIFISVNGQPVIGGEPFQTKDGSSVDSVMLQIKMAIARLASKDIRTL